MLHRKNNEWSLSPYKVKYTQRGEALETYVHDPEWWIEFARIWEHTDIVEISEVTYTEDQQARLAEINDYGIGEGFSGHCVDYVVNGDFPHEKKHILKELQLTLENKQLGQLATDLEIRLLMGGL